jgi:hypothetical protein
MASLKWEQQARVEHQLREFFELASLRCGHCGELTRHPEDATADERSLAERGIRTVADWDRRMDEYMAWAQANKETVLAVMPQLPEWEESCKALRQVLEQASDAKQE